MIKQVCEHGSLARQCELCERDENIRGLEARVKELEKERDEARAALLEIVAVEEGSPTGTDYLDAETLSDSTKVAITAARAAIGKSA